MEAERLYVEIKDMFDPHLRVKCLTNIHFMRSLKEFTICQMQFSQWERVPLLQFPNLETLFYRFAPHEKYNS